MLNPIYWKNAWMCIWETRLIMSLIEDRTGECWTLHAVTNRVKASAALLQLYRTNREVCRYLKLHAAVASCLWDESSLHRACSAQHCWCFQQLHANSTAYFTIGTAWYNLLFIVTLENHIYYLSRQLTWCCKCDLWNCWSLQNCESLQKESR